MTLVLTNEDAQSLLSMEEVISVLETSYRALGLKRAVNRPRAHSFLEKGEGTFYMFKSMEGILADEGYVALRVSSDLIQERAVAGIEKQVKIPAAPGGKFVGFVLLFSTETLELLAIVQDGYLQKMRVGGSYAVGAKYLARPDSRVLGILGAGLQAEGQIEAIKCVLDIEEVRVYSPTNDRRNRFAEDWSKKLGIKVRAVSQPEKVLKDIDLLVEATSSNKPVYDGSDLPPGVHVNNVNARALDSGTVERADLVVVRNQQQPLFYRIGESTPEQMKAKTPYYRIGGASQEPGESKATEAGIDKPLIELGDVVLGKHPGRTSRDQVSLLAAGIGGGVGLGTEFAAVCGLMYRKALENGLGYPIPSDLFLQSIPS